MSASHENKNTKTSHKKRVSIAIQGGGAHGSFSWGVLDRLLEDDRFHIEGLTGTSAGGMNAVAVAQGLTLGGVNEARRELRNFWESISDAGRHSVVNNRGFIDRMLGKYTMYHSPGFCTFDTMSTLFSPYQMNPMGHDPLKDTIQKCFDFDVLRQSKACKVFLCATHVYTGRLKVFNLEDLSVEKLLATACLPTLYGAVKVDGEYYWDGGFIGNPVFFPLIYNCDATDIIFIQLNPTIRTQLPMTAQAIRDRLNEITNNSSVIREMRAMHLISKLLDDGLLDKARMKRMYMHVIKDEEIFQDLGWSSKLNTEWEFIYYLYEHGRRAAEKWINEHYDKVGVETSAPIEDHFIGSLTEGGGVIYT